MLAALFHRAYPVPSGQGQSERPLANLARTARTARPTGADRGRQGGTPHDRRSMVSTVLFTRGPRRAGPAPPAEDAELQEPPVVPEPANSGIGSVLMYAPLGLGSLAM